MLSIYFDILSLIAEPSKVGLANNHAFKGETNLQNI